MFRNRNMRNAALAVAFLGSLIVLSGKNTKNIDKQNVCGMIMKI